MIPVRLHSFFMQRGPMEERFDPAQNRELTDRQWTKCISSLPLAAGCQNANPPLPRLWTAKSSCERWRALEHMARTPLLSKSIASNPQSDDRDTDRCAVITVAVAAGLIVRTAPCAQEIRADFPIQSSLKFVKNKAACSLNQPT